jgi:hypothetical protein
MRTNKYYYRRWLIQSPIALVLIGLGVSLICEAAMVKYSGAELSVWFTYGTIALIVFNSGIALFGDAVLQRVRYENSRQSTQ